MVDLVSAWSEGESVRVRFRKGDTFETRAILAKWSFFALGLDSRDVAALSRDPRILSVVPDGKSRIRVDCRSKFARLEILEAIQGAVLKSGAKVTILEGDVTPVRRMLSDNPSMMVDADPRLGWFDLETDSRASFDDMKRGNARILSWAISDRDGEAAEVLAADSDDAERDLLRAFFKRLESSDCVLAWNGSGFDFPVIENRSAKLGISIEIRRWTWLDHLEVFKKYNMHSDDGGEAKVSFKLDHVATYLLGEGKDDFDASKTWEAWEAGGESRARLLRYNAKDTRLLPRIEEKTGFVSLHLAVAHICRVFPDTESLNATAQGDGFLLALGSERGYRWKTKRKFEEGSTPAPFAGAYVMAPQRLGAIESVHVCDFAGLYPSIMRTFNMSPDTKIWEGSPVPAQHCKLPGRETRFRTDRDGMFRIALDQLVAKRAEYQRAMKVETPGSEAHARAKRLQGAFKIVANSFYGICGSPYSRFFDVEIAEGVTQTGKWLLESVIAEAKTRGLDPFYGDTDSVFVSGDIDGMKGLVSAMNASWSSRLAPFGISKHHIDLDFEKTFKRVIMVSAKRYAGKFSTYKGKVADPNAAPEVKGLEFKRGDTIRFARDMQSEIVEALLVDGPLPEPAVLRAKIDKWRRVVLNEPIELKDVTITQSLTKPLREYVSRYTLDRCMSPNCNHDFGSMDSSGPEKCPKCKLVREAGTVPAHVRVAKIMHDRGIPIGEGARVSYVVVGSGKGGIVAVPSSDEGVIDRVDRSYYWESRVFPATERVLEKVYPGIAWGESKEIRKQRSLELSGQQSMDLLFAGSNRAPVAVPEKKEPVTGVEQNRAPEPAVVRRRRVEPAVEPAAVAEPVVEPSRGRVRRKVESRSIIVVIQEHSEAADGGAESIRRVRIFEALKMAIEANPGTVPVKLRICIGDKVKVEIDTKLKIATTPEAVAALERLIPKKSILGL